MAGKSSLQLDGTSIAELLENVRFCNEELADAILNKEGVKPYFKIMVNGQDISLVQDLLTPIKTGDIVAIFPPIAGGQA